MRFITAPYSQWKSVLSFPIPGLTAAYPWEQDCHRDDRSGPVQGALMEPVFDRFKVLLNWIFDKWTIFFPALFLKLPLSGQQKNLTEA